MKKTLTLAALSAVLLTGAASAQITGNVALSTDYVFRGITQTDNGPAISGGFDYEHESGFYAGTWASSVDFGDDTTMEIDFYGGYTFSAAGFDWDIGGLLYAYPDSPDDQNFFEAYGNLSKDIGPVTWSGGVAYSPEFYLDTGEAVYLSTGLAMEIFEGITLDGAIGVSRFSDEFDFLDYEDYQIGLSGTVLNDIGWDLRVHELSDGGNETVVFTISQSFGG